MAKTSPRNSSQPEPVGGLDGRGRSTLSAFDRTLFQELQKDGRVPFVALADKLGVSEAHVRKRVARLTASGVFSITAIADPQVLGIDSMALLGLNVRGGQAAAVAETLVGMTGFDYVVQTAGGFNVLAEAACRSSSELYTLLRAVRAIPGVQRTETFVYLNLIRQQFQWSLDGARGGVQGEGSASFDALDVELIDELQRDGRAPFRRIARNLGVSERVVSTRVARLLDQNALQVIAVGNPATLGFEAMAWLGIKVDEGVRLEDAAALLERWWSLPGAPITYCSAAGPFPRGRGVIAGPDDRRAAGGLRAPQPLRRGRRPRSTGCSPSTCRPVSPAAASSPTSSPSRRTSRWRPTPDAAAGDPAPPPASRAGAAPARGRPMQLFAVAASVVVVAGLAGLAVSAGHPRLHGEARATVLGNRADPEQHHGLRGAADATVARVGPAGRSPRPGASSSTCTDATCPRRPRPWCIACGSWPGTTPTYVGRVPARRGVRGPGDRLRSHAGTTPCG